MPRRAAAPRSREGSWWRRCAERWARPQASPPAPVVLPAVVPAARAERDAGALARRREAVETEAAAEVQAPRREDATEEPARRERRPRTLRPPRRRARPSSSRARARVRSCGAARRSPGGG